MSNYSISETGSFAFYTFRPRLIRSSYHDLYNEFHREKVAKWDAIANAVTYRVAEELTAQNPKFYDEPEEGKELGDEIRIPTWGDYNDNSLLKRVFRKVRIQGNSIISLYDKLPFYRIYAGVQIGALDEDDFGNIVAAKVNYTSPRIKVKAPGRLLNQEIPIDNKNNFYLEHNNEPGNHGALEPIWDTITYIRYDIDAMSFHDMRTAQGVYISEVDKDKIPKKGQWDAFQSALDYMSSKYLISPPPGVTIKHIGGGGTSNYESHIKILLEKVVAATGFPMRFFTGEPQGTLSTSGEDSDRIQTKLKRIHAGFEDWIKAYVKIRHGIEVFKVVPVIGEAMSQEDEDERLDDEESNKKNNTEETKNE